MPNPNNADGTKQVAPPTQSAFAKDSSDLASAPKVAPQPLQAPMGTPGFSGAIVDLMRALASSFAPRSIVQRPQLLQQQIAANDGSNPPLGQAIDR